MVLSDHMFVLFFFFKCKNFLYLRMEDIKDTVNNIAK
jgi:hypothetical protein